MNENELHLDCIIFKEFPLLGEFSKTVFTQTMDITNKIFNEDAVSQFVDALIDNIKHHVKIYGLKLDTDDFINCAIRAMCMIDEISIADKVKLTDEIFSFIIKYDNETKEAYIIRKIPNLSIDCCSMKSENKQDISFDIKYNEKEDD